MKLLRSKKLSAVLTVWIGALLVSLNLIATIMMTFVTGAGMNDKQDDFLNQTALNAKKQVEQFIDKYISLTELLADDALLKNVIASANSLTPASDSPEMPDLIVTLQGAVEDFPDIMGIGFANLSEDYLYTQDGTRLNTRASERDYYEMGKEDTYVTEPYIDTATGKLCVSVTTPVYNGSRVDGILIMDLSMTQLSDFLDQLSFGETGQVILLSADNTILGIENKELLGKNFKEINISENLASKLENPDSTVIRCEISGKDIMGTTTRLSGGGWNVLAFMSVQEYNAQTVKSIINLVLILMVNTLIVVVVSCGLIRKKLKPISELNEDLKAISEGKLKVSMTYESEDEVGEMAEALRMCSKNLSAYVDEIDRLMTHLADSDLTAVPQVEFMGDFIPIQSAISQSMEKLTELMRGISEAADQVSASSDQVSDGAQALAQGATEQASSVEELTNTISELSVTVRENSEMARLASENVTRVNGEIVESSNKMEQSLKLMEEIRTSAGKVDEIIKSIENIAFQTNILALNAAVEAARAGQAGKGFAVVADEVRNLAAKSAEASQATTELIGNMVFSIKKGSESMMETKQYMDNVVSDAAEITEVFRKISQASEQQSVSVAQVTQGADQISGVVQTNSATAEQSAAASEELSGQAQMLKDMISQFKLSQ
ncbi:MAG: methyl-accepting chemotaxis protein [Clostridium sp.]